MGKRTKAKRVESEPLVNAYAAAHGDYAETTIPITAGEIEGERGNIRVLRNRGGTAVDRWINAANLEPSQIRAIELYVSAWSKVYSHPRVVMGWGERIAFSRGGDEARVATLIDAQELLKFLDERIFQMAPHYYFDVWQNIVLFDQPAGITGGGNRNSAERAKTICLFIADMIATILRL
jgi:hypothetical protein